MYPYTHKNHFQFGYKNKLPFELRTQAEDQFYATYGSIETPLTNWVEANKLAARKIYEQKVGDIVILLSGGLDSEICVRSFSDQNLPFKTVSLRYKGGFNQSELEHVENLKSEISFQHEYVDMDLESYWCSSELDEIVNPIQCVSPILASHLWLASRVGETPVIAQGEALLKKKIPCDYIPGISPYTPSEWFLEESEMFCSLYSHFIIQQKPGIPGFFQFLPEQTSTFLFHNPYLKKLINNEVHGKLTTRSSKNLMSCQFYPNLKPREKLTGFEDIMPLQIQKRKELSQRFPNSEAVVQFSMGEMHKMLSKIE